jgi:hypothetical protein
VAHGGSKQSVCGHKKHENAQKETQRRSTLPAYALSMYLLVLFVAIKNPFMAVPQGGGNSAESNRGIRADNFEGRG